MTANMLAEIRSALGKVDQWIELHKKYDEQFPAGWATHMMSADDDREYTDGYATIERLRNNHLDYLRALLPVVEAAEVVAETDSQYTRHSRDEIVALQKALKALN